MSSGTTAPDASAALEIASSTKGVLLPCLTEAGRLAMGTGSSPAPAGGLILYQTDGSQPGFYYNSGPAGVPEGSGVLDPDATTVPKDFLPPRLSQAQRDAIASPATGLLVYF